MLQIKNILLLISVICFSTLSWSQAYNPQSELTVLSLQDAQSLFLKIVEESEIPFDFPDGCHAKAQKISMILEKEGVITGKAFVEGQIFNQSKWGLSFWLFHVAPMVLVEINQVKELYIVDPFLAKKILTYNEWLTLIENDPRTKIQKKYFSNRFVYNPSHLQQDPSSYVESFIYDMDLRFKQIRKRISNK